MQTRVTLALSLLLLHLAGCSAQPSEPTAAPAAATVSLDQVAEQFAIPVADLQIVRSKKNLSNEDLMAMDRSVLVDLVDRLKFTRPGPEQAIEQRLMVMRDEFGRIPPDAEMTAQQQMQALKVGFNGTAGGLDSAGWTDRGPGNIGGRVRGLVVHPTTASTLFCGGVAGGIWRSTNSGASWSKVDDLMDNLAVSTIAFTPGNPNIMYAGTGEGFGNGDSIQGAGIFKSTNGGSTWTRLASTNNSNFFFVNRLALQGITILAATSTGIWRSTDGGTSWTRTFVADCRDVKFHPTRVGRVIAHSRTTACGIVSADSGVTWANCGGLATGGIRRVEFAWSQGYTGAGNGVCYALKESNSQLYRSTNGGVSFSLVSTNTFLGSQGWYDNALWVAPLPANSSVTDDMVVAGGIDLWRSINGGTTFTKISQWFSWPNSAHADHHAIVQHPGYNGTTNRQVYFGNDGGVWRANDVATVSTLSGWTNLNSSLGITQFYGGSSSSTDIVVGGTQDNGTLRRISATPYNGWTQSSGGDGGFTASDPTDPNYHYMEFQNGVFRRSTNGGTSASTIRTFANTLFIAPFILDPNNANTLLFGADVLWRSNNVKAVAPAWTSIKAALGRISAIAVAKGNPNIIWVGHNNGSVFSTTNGTAAAPTWTQRDAAIPNRYVTRIVIDERNHNTVYVCLGGFSAGNIYKTTNGGGAWAALPGLPAVPIRDMEIHPTQRNWFYAAAQTGLLVSEDSGSTWTATATPANVTIDEMFFLNNDLTLATHGRGMFRQTAVPPPVAVTSLYYRFDTGRGTRAVNYGDNPAPVSSMVHGGTTANGPWQSPGKIGKSMLQGSSNTSATHFNYCDTGFKGPINGDLTMAWWMKERINPGTALSYLWGGINGFRCFTNGVASTGLWVRSWGGTPDIQYPGNIQTTARAAGGACVALTINGATRQAQWYLNGVKIGAVIPISGPVSVAAAATSFNIGKETSNTNSSVYDMDEFHLVHRVATDAEIASWCKGGPTLYYKFDRGLENIAVNYGFEPSPSTMVNSGAGPWQLPGRFGRAMLQGSSNSSSAHFNYCDTGFLGPVQGDFTVHWWMKERFAPGTALSYVWGGIGNFRCFTNGVAGTGLWVRNWGGADLQFPGNVQVLARAAAGVCVGLTVSAQTRKAQWYVNGAPFGAAIAITGAANVPAGTSSFKIGVHTSNVNSSVYDIDEFRFDNRTATAAEIKLWCARPSAGSGVYARSCGIALDSLGGPPRVGNSLYAHTIAATPGVPTNCLFVVGLARVPSFDMGIALPPLAGCRWYARFDVQALFPTAANGTLVVPGGVPNSPSLAGLHIDTQVLGLQGGSTLKQSNPVSHVVEIN